MQALVSTHWLADHIGDPGLRIVDCSWHMPASGRSGREEYAEAHIHIRSGIQGHGEVVDKIIDALRQHIGE